MTDDPEITGERTGHADTGARSRSARLYRAGALGLLTCALVVLVWWYIAHVRASTIAVAERPKSRSAAAVEMRLPPLEVGRRLTARTEPVPPGQALSTGAREEAPVAARDIAPRDSRRREPSADLLRTAASSPVLLSAAASTLATTAQPANVPALVSWANSLGSGGWPEPPAPPAAKSVLKGDGTSDATLLRNRRFLLPKGSFLNCTLETAIDSTLPGMTTCVLAEDAFGADGRIVLLERGTRLIGESRAELRSGQNRVAVEWNDARTPTGVQLVLSSAATDSLGRAGVPGQVDRHLGDRFGAAVFLSFIDAAAGAASARQQSSGTVIYNPQASRDIASEALRASIAIPPTLHVAPGSRIQVIVAADVNFRSVYHLVADELR